MKHKKSILEGNIIYTLFAILMGFLTGAIILAIAGMNPGVIYAKLISGIFSKPKFLAWSVVYATPLIFTGLSVAFSFRTGVFNIGAEGQFVVGSLAATVIGIVCPFPAIITVPLCLIAAAAAGAVWSAFCGLLKVKKGINEVLSFIMMNWIAYYLSNYIVNIPGIKANAKETTVDILENAQMLMPLSVRQMTGCNTTNYGIILALIAAVIIWYLINKTTLGYELRSVGFNSYAAEYGGINSGASVMKALAISGALAGLGGAIQILGNAMHIAQFAGQEGFGFQGITVALIASSNPIGCIFAGLFYGAMKYGGSKLNLVGAPKEVLDIIMGAIVLVIAISHVFKTFAQKKMQKGGK